MDQVRIPRHKPFHVIRINFLWRMRQRVMIAMALSKARSAVLIAR